MQLSRLVSRSALLLTAAALPVPCFAALTWDSAGLTDNWSTAAGNPNWLPGSVVWTQNEDAIFNGTAETVTVTTANTFNNITFDVTGFIIANGAGSLTLANDFASTVTVTNAADTATIAESLANNGVTASSLTKAGPGALVLGGTTASTYSGQTLVTAGTLRAASATALGAGGAGAETIVSSGATFDAGAQALTNTEIFRIAGTGVGGAGALVNTGADQQNAFNRVELTADSSVGGSGRFDLRPGTTPTLDLAGFTLTKTGANQVSVVGGNITAGNITIDAGTFGIETTTTATGSGTITINSSGSLGLWANAAAAVTRAIVSNNGTIRNLGSSSTINSPVTINGGTTITSATTQTQTLAGNITGTGPLAINGPGAVALTGSNSYTGGTTITEARLQIGTNIAGVPDGTITVNGDGIVNDGQFYMAGAATLPATRNFIISGRGGNAVDATQRGAIRVEAGAIIDGNIALAANAAIGSNSGTGTLNGIISGGFELTKVDPQTLVLAGANSYTGATTINAGTLTLDYSPQDNSKLSDSAPLIFNNGTLSLVDGTHAETVLSTTLSANAVAAITSPSGTATINLGAITRGANSRLNLSGDFIALTSSGTVGQPFGAWMTIANTSLATRDGANFIVSVTPDDVSTIAGPGNTITDGMGQVRLTDGAGTVLLGGIAGDTIDANTITRSAGGLATIDTAGKTLRLGESGAILSGTGSGGITFGTAPNSGVLTAGGPSDNTPGTLEFNQIAGNLAVNSTIADNGTGAVSLVKFGAPDLFLGGTNTYSGGTTLVGGILRIANSDSALGTGNLNFAANSTLATSIAGGARNVPNDIVINAGVTGGFDSGYFSLTLNGVVSGPGNLSTASAVGTTILAGTNTYTGTTSIVAGTVLSVSSIKDVGDVTGSSLGNVASAANGTIALAGRLLYTGTGSTTNRVVNLAGAAPSIDQSGSGLLKFNSAFTATSATVKTLTLQGSTAGTGEIAGAIVNLSATNTTALTKAGTGTWALGALNTYTGGTTINGGVLDLIGGSGGGTGKIRGTATVNATGTLRLTANDATGYNTDASRLSVINLSGGSMDINTILNQTLGSAVINMTAGSITGIAGSNLDFFAGASALNSLASASSSTISGVKLNLRQNNGLTVTVEDGAAAQDLVISSVISNSTGFTNNLLTKAGPGTLVLSGASTYTTGTTVNAGTLLVNNTTGSGTGTAAVTVNNAGSVIGGTGTISGALTANSGTTVAPGAASAGTLTAGATVLAGIYAYEIDGATADRLAVNGALNITGAALNVSVLGGGATQPEYIIATYTGALTGTFTGLPEAATVLPGYTISYATANQIKLVGSGPSYSNWATSFGLDPMGNGAAGFVNGGGFENGTEFILGGSPVSGSNNPKIYSLAADSDDVGTDKELIMTIAVPVGTPAFSAGSPTSTASIAGFGITVRGSTTLSSFPVTVNPVAPVTTGLPALMNPQGGVNYEYRSFSLGGSNGMPGKGFLQVIVTNP